MIEPIEDRARRSLRLGPISVRHRDPPRRIGNSAADFALERIGQETSENKAPAISFRIGGAVARTKSPNCRLLTAKHAMANSLTVTSRTGPSPSSGNRRSSDPIRKVPPIGGLQRRGMTVGFGSTPARSRNGARCHGRIVGTSLCAATGVAVAHSSVQRCGSRVRCLVSNFTCYFCFSSSQKAVPPSAFINSRIFSRGITPQRLAQA